MKNNIFCIIICFLSFSTCPNNLQAVDSYTCIELKGHTNKVNCAAFSPDGKKVVTASSDTTARIWDAESGNELKNFKPKLNIAARLDLWIPTTPIVRFASFSPDGNVIVAALERSIQFWDAESGNVLRTIAGHPEESAPERRNHIERTKNWSGVVFAHGQVKITSTPLLGGRGR